MRRDLGADACIHEIRNSVACHRFYQTNFCNRRRLELKEGNLNRSPEFLNLFRWPGIITTRAFDGFLETALDLCVGSPVIYTFFDFKERMNGNLQGPIG